MLVANVSFKQMNLLSEEDVGASDTDVLIVLKGLRYLTTMEVLQRTLRLLQTSSMETFY